ncbi:MAG: translocation/assembly module TamB domain-containing protein, partial [Deltaproteobacteria bacterium]
EIRDVCRPEATTRLSVEGPLAALAGLLSAKIRATGSFSAELTAEGTGKSPRLRVETRDAQIEQYRLGEMQAETVVEENAIRLERVRLLLDLGGEALVSGTVKLLPFPSLDAQATLERVDFARLLDRVDIRHSLVDFRFSGRAHLAGRLFGPFRLQGEGAGEASGLTIDDWGWDRTVPRHRLLTAHDPFQVSTRLIVDGDGVRLERARLLGNGDEVDGNAFIHYDPLRGLSIHAKAGRLDLGAFERISSIPWRGTGAASLTVEGSYADPILTGHADLDDVQFDKIHFGHVAADVSFRGLVLSFPLWLGSEGKTAYSASARIDLGKDFDSRIDLDVPSGRLEDLTQAVADLAPPMAEIHRAFAGSFSGHASLSGPIERADATGELAFGGFSVYGRSFSGGVLDAKLAQGRSVEIGQVSAVIGSGRIEGSGRVGARGELDLTVRGERLPLAELLWPNGEGADAQGTLALDGAIGGSLSDWLPSGSARIDGFRAFGVPLGLARLHAASKGESLHFSGAAGDEETVDGTIALRGNGPYQALVRGETARLDRYLRGYGFRDPPAGTLSGSVTLEGEILRPERSKGQIQVDRLTLSRGALKVATEATTELELDAGRLSLADTVIVGKSTRLTLAGSRDVDGSVDGAVRGRLDARLLEGLVPNVHQLGGVFQIGAEVHGPWERPAIVGTARFSAGQFDWNGWPLTVRDFSGVAEFSERRVVLGRSHGRLNGGLADLAGDLGMDGWQIERCNLEAHLEEVPLAIPEAIPTLVTGRLALDGALSAGLLMSGELHVVRARYSRDFEIDRLLQTFSTGALHATPFAQRGPPLHLDIWLRGDGDLRVQNNVAELGLKGDLHLTGTNERTGLMGSVAAKEGLAQFRGNEYHVSDATLTFLAPNRIAPSFDVSADTDVRQYRVFVHAYGTPESYRLSLRSQPALSEDDIVKLLTFGVTSQDSASAVGAAGQAGYLGDVLWNISGLHDQVKKIIPHNRVIKDFSFNVGSAFLEATGQVEPVAQIESRVFSDSLRLRAQLPLSEYSGKRAEAEWQLSDHMSLQGEWNNDYSDYNIGDLGLDLRMRWEFGD